MKINILILSSDTLITGILKAEIHRQNHNVKILKECQNIFESEDKSNIDFLIIDSAICDNTDLKEFINKIRDVEPLNYITIVLLTDKYSKYSIKELDRVLMFFDRNLADLKGLTELLNRKAKDNKPLVDENLELKEETKQYEEKLSSVKLYNPEKITVLVTDDSKPVRKFVSNILQQRNFGVSTFENGQLLLDFLKSGNKGDIIILDNEMPVKDGITTLIELKSQKEFKNIPVLFLSAVSAKDQIVKALQLGADDYMVKPFNVEEFFARLNVHLKIDAMQAKLVKQNQKLAESNIIIERKNKDIISSINYAKRIQNAIFPTSEEMKSNFNEYFIIWKPLNIVSGDFYWMKKIGKYIAVAAVDCTGHGVPGAFMSMLGITFLNEITGKSRKPDAAKILDKLRENIKKSLRQTGKFLEQKDGMDLSLCIIDTNKNELQYAGANNPLYIVRKTSYATVDFKKVRTKQKGEYKLYHIRPDKQPIGIHKIEKPFTNNSLQLFPNDKLYLFSDGYIDQFGGEKSKKFLSKRFKDLILDIHNKPMPVQKEKLIRTFDDWKGKEEQVDDVLVIGIKSF